MYTTLEVSKVQEEAVVLVVLVETVDQPYVQTKTETSLSTITLEHQSTPAVAEVVVEVTVVLVVLVVLVDKVVLVIITTIISFQMDSTQDVDVVPEDIVISKDL